MSTEDKTEVTGARIVYGEIVYWITIVAAIVCMIGPVISMANPENNVLNPHYLFSNIFEGKSAADIWKDVGGEFPGGHFYLSNFTKGDGFTQFGLALGCSVGLWALLACAVVYIREKNYTYMLLSLWVSLLIFLSMVGIIAAH